MPVDALASLSCGRVAPLELAYMLGKLLVFLSLYSAT